MPSSPVHQPQESTLRRLREATDPQHRQLEDSLALMDSGLSLDRYTQVLIAFHRVYGSAEPLIESLLTDAAVLSDLDWPNRRKAHLLSADLAHLGADGHPGEDVSSEFLDSVGAVFGALYVFEGATLGGQHIAPHVERTLGTNATQFFRGYGDETGARWHAFRNAVRSHVAPESVMADQAEAAAIRTFEIFQEQADAMASASGGVAR